jgi:hypothetical protein
MKHKIILPIIIGIILIPVLVYFRSNLFLAKDRIINNSWGITITSDFMMIFQRQDQHDFQGKGSRYVIFEAKENSLLPNIEIVNNKKNIQISSGTSDEGRNHEVEEFVYTVAADLKISENNKPKFEFYYVWRKLIKYNNELIVLYFPYDNKIYFVEKLR